MTTSLNGETHKSIDDKIPLLLRGFTADLAFHGDLNLIQSISEAFSHPLTGNIFTGIQLFDDILLEINRIQSTAPESKLLPINPSASTKNPITDVTKHPISAALLEPIPDALDPCKSAIMTMRCLLVLALISTIQNPKKYLKKHLKSCAREIRLAISYQTFESRKSSLDHFAQSLNKTFGINQLLINISQFRDDLSDSLPKKLFSEVSDLSQSIDISHKLHASIQVLSPFMEEPGGTEPQDLVLTATEPALLTQLDDHLDIPYDEPDDRVSRFSSDDQELEDYLRKYSAGGSSLDDSQELTLFGDACNEDLERQKSHWQHNTQAHLPYSTSLFNPIERSWLISELEFGLTNEKLSATALIISLSICTNRSYEDTLDLVYGDNGDITENGIFRKHISAPDDAVVPDISESSLYKEHEDRLELELPALVKQLLDSALVSDRQDIPLREAIKNKDQPNYITIETFFENIRNKYSSRFIIPRVKNQLKHFLLSQERDPTLAYMLFGTKDYRPPMPNYYRFMPIQSVSSKYKQYSSEYFSKRDI